MTGERCANEPPLPFNLPCPHKFPHPPIFPKQKPTFTQSSARRIHNIPTEKQWAFQNVPPMPDNTGTHTNKCYSSVTRQPYIWTQGLQLFEHFPLAMVPGTASQLRHTSAFYTSALATHTHTHTHTHTPTSHFPPPPPPPPLFPKCNQHEKLYVLCALDVEVYRK